MDTMGHFSWQDIIDEWELQHNLIFPLPRDCGSIAGGSTFKSSLHLALGVIIGGEQFFDLWNPCLSSTAAGGIGDCSAELIRGNRTLGTKRDSRQERQMNTTMWRLDEQLPLQQTIRTDVDGEVKVVDTVCCIVGCGDGKTNERMLLIEMFDKTN